MIRLTPTESDVLAALRSFLLSVLANGGAVFTATITGTTLTVATLLADSGAINQGDQLLGPGIIAETTITGQVSGDTGGVGVYTIDTAQEIDAAITMSTGFDVIQGQTNRVAEPSNPNYVVMWPIDRPRLSTNIDKYLDTYFNGSISGSVLTVEAPVTGKIKYGASLFGTNVAAGTKIGLQITGTTGGAGTYAVSPSQTISAEIMACGELQATQENEIVVQCDIHSSDLALAGNAAETIATMFRDAYACDFIAALQPAVSPLNAENPRQIAFQDAEQQVEDRWSVDLHLQANQTVSGIPQQFASALNVGLIDVDARFPPS